MKIAVIGGGIFGITTAFTLGEEYDVELFEKNNSKKLISFYNAGLIAGCRMM